MGKYYKGVQVPCVWAVGEAVKFTLTGHNKYGESIKAAADSACVDLEFLLLLAKIYSESEHTFIRGDN